MAMKRRKFNPAEIRKVRAFIRKMRQLKAAAEQERRETDRLITQALLADGNELTA